MGSRGLVEEEDGPRIGVEKELALIHRGRGWVKDWGREWAHVDKSRKRMDEGLEEGVGSRGLFEEEDEPRIRVGGGLTWARRGRG